MSNIRRIMKKVRGRSPKELRVRAAQWLNALAEREGWSSQTVVPNDAAFFGLLEPDLMQNRELSAAAMLEHFRRRSRPRFFPSFSEKQKTIDSLRSRFDSSALIDRARRITEGSFDLLGFQNLHFGAPINWHLDPVSGVVTPNKHWSEISYLDPMQAGDKKIIWELNRHAYFTTLGRAYWRTEDEVYAQTFVTHLNGWIQANPPKLGINWASSLEVSFRAISWLWALHFFRDSPHLTPQLFLRIIKLLYLHGRHLETYLSTYFSPNTHLTGEALGLFYLGTLLPELQCAVRWRELGEGILLSQLGHHVRADGVYFEQSSYYHRYTTDFYTHLLILLRENDRRIAPQLEEKLKALLDHLMSITRPDGTTPLFGDDDGGRLVFLDEHAANDFRSALSNGAALFQRSDYKYVASKASEETMWLLGHGGLRVIEGLESHPPDHESRDFPEGGYYVMRDRWTPDANYLLVDCGPHGGLKHGHAHADALSFELAARGRNVLVDPGTFTYTGSKELRDHFRSSFAHNTLTVDGESSSVSEGPFSWKEVAESFPLQWISRPRFDFFLGAHSGYERLPSPVIHKRSLLFVKQDYWVMVDRVEATSAHAYSLNFQFDQGTTAEIVKQDGNPFVKARVDAPGLESLELWVCNDVGEWRSKQGQVSRCYGERVDAPMLSFELKAEDNQELITVLIPRAVGDEQVMVRKLACEFGSAVEIRNGANSDLLLLGDGRQLTVARGVSAVFELAWIRFDRAGSTLKELLAINGSELTFGGQSIVRSSELIEYLSAQRCRDELRGEMDRVANWHTPLLDWHASNVELTSR
jgi:hypothetical protein